MPSFGPTQRGVGRQCLQLFRVIPKTWAGHFVGGRRRQRYPTQIQGGDTRNKLLKSESNKSRWSATIVASQQEKIRLLERRTKMNSGLDQYGRTVQHQQF